MLSEDEEDEEHDSSYSSKLNTDPTLTDAELFPELLPDTSWELSEVKVEALGTWEKHEKLSLERSVESQPCGWSIISSCAVFDEG